MSQLTDEAAPPRQPARRWLFLIPVLVFASLGPILYFGLGRNSSELPSTLIGRTAPEFALPALAGRDDHGLARSDLGGKPMLVNVFASWCVPCRIEHPILTELAREGVTIQGINYKDPPEQAAAFLAELGDPYARVGADRDGGVAIDWGVYGVPETFLLDGQGRILYRHPGPLQARDLEQTIRPMLAKLAQ